MKQNDDVSENANPPPQKKRKLKQWVTFGLFSLQADVHYTLIVVRYLYVPIHVVIARFNTEAQVQNTHIMKQISILGKPFLPNALLTQAGL